MMDLLGWQPGIPDNAAIWDEEWDKFEDEGMRGGSWQVICFSALIMLQGSIHCQHTLAGNLMEIRYIFC